MVTRLAQDTIQALTKAAPDGISEHLILNTTCPAEDIVATIDYFRLLFPFTYPEYVVQDAGILLTIDRSETSF